MWEIALMVYCKSCLFPTEIYSQMERKTGCIFFLPLCLSRNFWNSNGDACDCDVCIFLSFWHVQFSRQNSLALNRTLPKTCNRGVLRSKMSTCMIHKLSDSVVLNCVQKKDFCFELYLNLQPWCKQLVFTVRQQTNALMIHCQWHYSIWFNATLESLAIRCDFNLHLSL